LHGAANFPSAPLLGPGPSLQTQKRLLSTPVRSDDVRGHGWAERRAASSSYQTLSQLFPQHCSLHPWSPKLVCPDKKILLGLPAKFQTWTLAVWLWPGPGSQLSNFSFRGALSSTTPCPSPPPDTAGMPDLYSLGHFASFGALHALV
jgi:hypothetical protein